MANSIECEAIVYKVQTLADHGIRISLDLPETATMQMAMFAECQRMGVLLSVKCTPVVQDASKPDEADGKKSRPPKLSLRGA